METLCFFPLEVSIQAMVMVRMFLAKVSMFWMMCLTSSPVLSGSLVSLVLEVMEAGNILTYFASTPLSSIVMPFLIGELVSSTLVLLGIWRRSAVCLVPWLLANVAVVLVLSLMLVGLMVTTVQVQDQTDQETNITILKDILKCVASLCLGFLIVLQMLSVCAMLAVFRGIQKSKTVVINRRNKTHSRNGHQFSVGLPQSDTIRARGNSLSTLIPMYSAEDKDMRIPMYSAEDKEVRIPMYSAEEKDRTKEAGKKEHTKSLEVGLLLEDDQDERSTRSTLPATDRNSKCNSWNTFKFTFDKENFE